MPGLAVDSRFGVRISKKRCQVLDAIIQHPMVRGPELAEMIYPHADNRKRIKLIYVHVWYLNELLDGTGIQITNPKKRGYIIETSPTDS